MTAYIRHGVLLVLCLAAACGKSRQREEGRGGGGGGGGGGPRDLVATANSFYESYAQALREGKREALAGFYHPTGALIVLDGQPQRMTRDGIDSLYRASTWQVPSFFTFDSLRFDSLTPRQVMVTGHARMLRPGADTTRIIYAALLQAVDSTFGIRFEHETPKSKP